MHGSVLPLEPKVQTDCDDTPCNRGAPDGVPDVAGAEIETSQHHEHAPSTERKLDQANI